MNITPVNSGEFSRMMDGIGFFERAPLLAVGVSGGADSMALLLLVDQWARSKGGKAIGLTVDHGLREESQSEAKWVTGELTRRGIEHHILVWQGPKPDSGIQEKARNVRRQLLFEWCRKHGVLHLCLGHHAEDQVETHLMRLARRGDDMGRQDNGLSGLAGMSQIREEAQARIIRPLLSVSKKRLEATLHSVNQTWLNDPSNESDRFERVRMRRAIAELEGVSEGASVMAETICCYGEERQDLEQLGAMTLATCAAIYPAGYARLDVRKLDENGEVAARFAFQRLIMTVGGRRYPIMRHKLDQIYRKLKEQALGGCLTLGGCLIAPSGDGVIIVREERNLPLRQPVTTDQTFHWDNRFLLSFRQEVKKSEPGFGQVPELGSLGHRGYDRLIQEIPSLRHHPVPLLARFTLPTLFYDDEIIAVSLLTNDAAKPRPHCINFEKTAFSPPEPALGGMFSVALTGFCTISDRSDKPQEVDERNDA